MILVRPCGGVVTATSTQDFLGFSSSPSLAPLGYLSIVRHRRCHRLQVTCTFLNSSTYQFVKWVANCDCFLGDILYFRYNFLKWLISSPDNFVSRTGSITSKETKTNALRTDLWLFAATYRLSNAGSQLGWLVTCLLIICC
jgi:hypothetical protein